MSNFKQNFQQITEQIELIEKKCSYNTKKVQLLAVSKTKPVNMIAEAIETGQCLFGENYVQEAVEKIQHFASIRTRLQWHLIGPIQSNKTRLVAEHFDWVHTVDREKIAVRLDSQRAGELSPLQVLIQVNSSGESAKSGIVYDGSQTQLDAIITLANTIEQLPHLTLRGLMCIPQPETEYTKQMKSFMPLVHLFNQLKARYPKFDTLSMGMSGDMQAAIESGSTMVRIGSALFGSR